MIKICVVTGSRAEYGLLSRLMQMIQEDSGLKLQVIATNMHLSPEFGLTYQEIEKDGFFINKKVEMLLSSDTANGTAKSVGLATIGFADAYEDLKPDLLLVLGDRYEILSAVTTALFYKIPVAHLHGGEITEGAYDDAIRHAITKMSHLHFTSTEEYRKRVIQLGENPERVFNVGAIGIDNIKHLKLLSRDVLERELQFLLKEQTILVTYHPVTLDENDTRMQFQCLLNVLNDRQDIRIIFTLPNSDTGGRVIIPMIQDFVKCNKDRAIAFASLGSLRYLSVLRCVSAVVGNSSSGIIEAPSFGIPTLNIGNRQKGRIVARSVLQCEISEQAIRAGLEIVLANSFLQLARNVINPYEQKNTAVKIRDVLKTYPLSPVIQKTFYNLNV
jgi:UDP-N-acetyl-D-glucosamine 2-epimerase, UDP-hydrolysing